MKHWSNIVWTALGMCKTRADSAWQVFVCQAVEHERQDNDGCFKWQWFGYAGHLVMSLSRRHLEFDVELNCRLGLTHMDPPAWLIERVNSDHTLWWLSVLINPCLSISKRQQCSCWPDLTFAVSKLILIQDIEGVDYALAMFSPISPIPLVGLPPHHCHNIIRLSGIASFL